MVHEILSELLFRYRIRKCDICRLFFFTHPYKFEVVSRETTNPLPSYDINPAPFLREVYDKVKVERKNFLVVYHIRLPL